MSMFEAIKHNPEHAEISTNEADLRDREKMVAIAKSVHVDVKHFGHAASCPRSLVKPLSLN
ncbi:hypothetical protein [Marinomonas fungiae]|uniref:hypothetical protein n=1 Tax=Marinomonas fungiae TaxID=1137284 RepID=UPI003A8F0DE6